jgi:hypothetical protein
VKTTPKPSATKNSSGELVPPPPPPPPPPPLPIPPEELEDGAEVEEEEVEEEDMVEVVLLILGNYRISKADSGMQGQQASNIAGSSPDGRGLKRSWQQARRVTGVGGGLALIDGRMTHGRALTQEMQRQKPRPMFSGLGSQKRSSVVL